MQSNEGYYVQLNIEMSKDRPVQTIFQDQDSNSSEITFGISTDLKSIKNQIMQTQTQQTIRKTNNYQQKVRLQNDFDSLLSGQSNKVNQSNYNNHLLSSNKCNRQKITMQQIIKVGEYLQSWMNVSSILENIKNSQYRLYEQQIQKCRKPRNQIMKYQYPSIQDNIQIVYVSSRQQNSVSVSKVFNSTKFLNYTIQYKINIFWSEMLPKHYDLTLQQFTQQPNQIFYGKAYYEHLNTSKCNLFRQIIKSILQKQFNNHQSIKTLKFMSYFCQFLQKYQAIKYEDGTIKYYKIQLQAQVMIDKIIVSCPEIKYIYDSICVNQNKQPIINGLNLIADHFRIQWTKGVYLKNIDFSNNIKIYNNIPIISQKFTPNFIINLQPSYPDQPAIFIKLLLSHNDWLRKKFKKYQIP